VNCGLIYIEQICFTILFGLLRLISEDKM